MITGLYAGLLGLLYIGLTINVIRSRFKHEVGLGDGGNETLGRSIRVHGNFAEFVPLALILIGFCEINGLPTLYLHLLGGTLFIARILHAIGLNKSIGASKERFLGTIGTNLVIIAASVIVIWEYLENYVLV